VTWGFIGESVEECGGGVLEIGDESPRRFPMVARAPWRVAGDLGVVMLRGEYSKVK